MPDSTTAPRTRLDSVDILRGIIMVLMVLDHTRDYFGVAANPTNIATTSVALFATRWITHFCAPVFFLLTGTGAFLSLRTKSTGELSRYLFTRGLWLLFLELGFGRFLWAFNVDYHVTALLVLWALGWSMIVLAALVHLPVRVVAIFGVALIALHNLLDGVTAESFGALAPVWSILHVQSVLINRPGFVVLEAYPLIPWIGVTAAGYALGTVFQWQPERRRQFLLRLGLGLCISFIVLRFVNVYGDPLPWSAQRSPAFTALSFFNANKYPPSLLFLLMTLGPAMLMLRAIDGRSPAWLQPALTYGRVPMFYYLLHILLIHVIAVFVCLVRYQDAHWMFASPDLANFPFARPPDWGYSLPIVYLVWATTVILLYPVCRWYGALRKRRHDWWLSYL